MLIQITRAQQRLQMEIAWKKNVDCLHGKYVCWQWVMHFTIGNI